MAPVWSRLRSGRESRSGGVCRSLVVSRVVVRRLVKGVVMSRVSDGCPVTGVCHVAGAVRRRVAVVVRRARGRACTDCQAWVGPCGRRIPVPVRRRGSPCRVGAGCPSRRGAGCPWRRVPHVLARCRMCRPGGGGVDSVAVANLSPGLPPSGGASGRRETGGGRLCHGWPRARSPRLFGAIVRCASRGAGRVQSQGSKPRRVAGRAVTGSTVSPVALRGAASAPARP